MSKKVPELRFKGFTDDWEERKLGGIFKKDTQKNKDLEFHSDSVISVAKMKLSPPSAKSSDEYMKTYNKIRKGNVAFEGHTNDEFPNGRFVLNDCQDGIVSHIYDVYSAVDEYNNEFMKRYINNPDVMRKILINATSSARMMKSLNSIEFLKQSILLPILSEQQKIGKFFKQLDDTIALHQRKLDLLKEQKKGFLQKMFPKNGSKVPELRFAGFTDAWEERKIKDIFKITRGQVLAATETSEEKSDISPFPVYSSQTKNNGLMGYYKDYLFDTAITWTTDGANAGTVSYRSGKFYSTNVNGVLISDKGYTNKAISEILNLEAWKWVSHVGNPKLMNNVMGDISIMIPSSFEEQDRLSDFLNQLDETIALHQRKLDLLKEQKKGYLQKMFPKNGAKVPELRFAGFADDWEERRLGEVTIYQNGKGYEDSQSSSGKFELINLNSISIDGGLKSSGKYIESADKTLLTDDLVMVLSDVGKGNLLGRVAIIPKDNYYVLNQRVALIRPKNKQQTNYLFSYINSHQRYFKLHGAGMSQLNISKGSVENFPLLLPSLPEQQQIGTFFAHLDTLISLHQRKLDLLKEQKKGFLQKMFV